ncbi:polysaccharide biosynthesis/export family protein [Aminobacter anthyllidis]|uniref:polysaccharide biosynthesis/export family protein n=1 Tax=Aminobacter anthyllidis TaxID=1035067 RepID=UPI0024560B10|nr:polysaccharide biosynthesis/export family protein [Aminobacter anthyllidis]MDH4987352.1 polysaccharide biosynthesis/export family protein [Aminobacter anthyllidis]
MNPHPGFHRHARRLLGVSGALCLTLAFSASTVFADDYHLGTQDKLTIRVVEWQTVEGAFRDWSSVSGDYTIGPSGNLSLPFVGETPAAGKTTAEIAEKIGKTLQDKFGLSDRPEASVEVAQYRPFYISGDIQTPGQYAYAPELTVLKAISIAGGMRRGADGARTERELITAEGSHAVLSDEQLRLMVTQVRIEAELAGKTEIAVPKAIAELPAVPAMIANETAIMASRQKKLTLRLQALDNLKGLLEREIVSLGQKSETQTRQIELARKELSGIGTLAQKGLVVNTRVLSAERSIAEMEGKILDLETAMLRAKQDISKAEQEAIDLKNDAESELAVERQKIVAELNAVTLKLGTQKGLIAEAGGTAPATAGSDQAISYVLVRKSGDGKAKDMAASEDTPVLPGDVLKVERSGAPLMQ